MSRNQLLAIVGVLLVLGVAFQHSPTLQIASEAACPSCPRWIVVFGPPIIRVPGSAGAAGVAAPRPSGEAELWPMLEGWIATPEPLLPPPTATPQDGGQVWHQDCLAC